MNKYLILSDALHGSTFAFVSQKSENIYFYPTNEMSRVWAEEQSSNPQNFINNLPQGVVVSAAKQLTPRFEYMLENAQFETIDSGLDIDISNATLNFKHSETVVNKKSASKNQRVSDIQIRKLSRNNKANAINYKILSFIAVNKKSSLISNIKKNKLRFDKSKSKFVTSIDSSAPNDSIEKIAGKSLERRVGTHLISSSVSEHRRASRRVKSLYVKEVSPYLLTMREKIDILVKRKTHR